MANEIATPLLRILRKNPAWADAVRLCLQVTAAALLGFIVSRPFDLPSDGLWVVLTAVMVAQTSAGQSRGVAFRYAIGTLAGAIYATIIGSLLPHASSAGLMVAVALTIGPLALLAALDDRFHVAPFTGVIVLIVAREFGETAVQSAMLRVMEVALGSGVALIVLSFVFPAKPAGDTNGSQ